jgi:ketosteroid isomerase-like protein
MGLQVTEWNKVVAVWRKQTDGSWKNVIDIWNADPTAWR